MKDLYIALGHFLRLYGNNYRLAVSGFYLIAVRILKSDVYSYSAFDLCIVIDALFSNFHRLFLRYVANDQFCAFGKDSRISFNVYGNTRRRNL